MVRREELLFEKVPRTRTPLPISDCCIFTRFCDKYLDGVLLFAHALSACLDLYAERISVYTFAPRRYFLNAGFDAHVVEHITLKRPLLQQRNRPLG